MTDKGAGYGEEGCGLSQCKLHTAHDEADGAIAKQSAERSGSLDSGAERQEETRADGASEGQH